MSTVVDKPPAKRMRMFRISEEDYEEIRRRAGERSMTITDYVVQSCLGSLDPNALQPEDWRAQVEDRLERLERAADLGSFG